MSTNIGGLTHLMSTAERQIQEALAERQIQEQIQEALSRLRGDLVDVSMPADVQHESLYIGAVVPVEFAGAVQSRAPHRLPDQDQMCQIAAWSDPPEDLLLDPQFLAIYEAIKTWDINVPAAYGGYCGATGNHVYAIYRALARLSPTQQPDPGEPLYEECLAVQGEPEIPVTAEMIAAGCDIAGPIERSFMTRIYRTMAALAPKDMSDASARDHAEAWANEYMARIAALEAELTFQAMVSAQVVENYEAALAGLYKQLAALTTANVAVPDPLSHNPFRAFEVDRRRVGG